MKQPAILMSACLMGVNCRYDGGSKMLPRLEELMDLARVVPVCPEIMGGLPTPRVPAERVGERILMRDGTDVTDNFRRGAQEALRLAKLYGVSAVVLKERSPSCGSGVIYDGTFTGGFKPGYGAAGEVMRDNGIPIYGESRIDELIEKLKEGVQL